MFNSVHLNMKFTIEEEHFNRMSFLGVSILRKDSKFIRSINYKHTWTGQYIPFASFCPIQLEKVDSYEIYSSGHIAYALKKQFNRGRTSGNHSEREWIPKQFYKKIFEKSNLSIKNCVSLEAKNVYICLPFKGNTLSTRIQH